MLLRFDDVSLAFGSRPLLDHVSLLVDEGERVCLVGRNGEGKSSLLRLVAGLVTPDDGSIWIRPGARIAMLAQDLDAVADVLVNVSRAAAAMGERLDTLEINPFIVGADGLVAADAVITLR